MRRRDQPRTAASLSAFQGTRPTRQGTAVTPQRRRCAHAHTRDGQQSDTQTDMLLGEPKSAICVQRFDDSLNSAIHTTYRSWLRSSSMREPRDPPSKVVSLFSYPTRRKPRHLKTRHVRCWKKNAKAGQAKRPRDQASRPIAI